VYGEQDLRKKTKPKFQNSKVLPQNVSIPDRI